MSPKSKRKAVVGILVGAGITIIGLWFPQLAAVLQQLSGNVQ